MNFVSTYIPWDYHEAAEGRFDFAGARDVGRFLEMACERGFHVGVRPGPFILAEWPYGFGSYGAVPAWFRRKHRDALVRERGGRIFAWHPLFPAIGEWRNRQPSYLAPAFLEATRRWFEALAPIIRPFVARAPRGVRFLQLDNEVNFFWTDRYRIDFHPTSLASYRRFLERRYEGSVESLNRAYGTGFARFADVLPPRRRGIGPEIRHDDWFEAAQETALEFLRSVRKLWEDLGIREPDVLFLTNDTPQAIPGLSLVLPDGRRKNACALHCLDVYPRSIPLPGKQLFDWPQATSLMTKLYDRWSDEMPGGAPGRFAMSIEMQAGHFGFLPKRRRIELHPHKIAPEATAQTVLRAIAHGMKAVGFYCLRGGLNLDGTHYDFQAPLGYDGERRPRYETLPTSGERLVLRFGRDLLESDEVESPVAVLADSRRLAPTGREDAQKVFSDDLGAVFGWLATAGFDPRVLDLALASEAELGACRAILFPCSDRIDERGAALLERFVAAGGFLLTLLWPGPLARSLYPAREGRPARPLFGRSRAVAFAVGGAAGSFRCRTAGVPRFAPPEDATVFLVPFAPSPPPARQVVALGYMRPVGRGVAGFIAPRVAAVYNSAALYTEPDAALEARRLLLRRLLRAGAALRPVLASDDPRDDAFARRLRSDGSLLVFAFGGSRAPEHVTVVRPLDLAAVGLAEDRAYVLEEVLGASGRIAAAVSGRELRDGGLALPLGRYGSAVVHVRARGA